MSNLRGRPSKPKYPDTGDKPKRGRERPHKPTPETGEKPQCGRGRPPKHTDLPSSSDLTEPKKHKVYHSCCTTLLQITFSTRN